MSSARPSETLERELKLTFILSSLFSANGITVQPSNRSTIVHLSVRTFPLSGGADGEFTAFRFRSPHTLSLLPSTDLPLPRSFLRSLPSQTPNSQPQTTILAHLSTPAPPLEFNAPSLRPSDETTPTTLHRTRRGTRLLGELEEVGVVLLRGMESTVVVEGVGVW